MTKKILYLVLALGLFYSAVHIEANVAAKVHARLKELTGLNKERFPMERITFIYDQLAPTLNAFQTEKNWIKSRMKYAAQKCWDVGHRGASWDGGKMNSTYKGIKNIIKEARDGKISDGVQPFHGILVQRCKAELNRLVKAKMMSEKDIKDVMKQINLLLFDAQSKRNLMYNRMKYVGKGCVQMLKGGFKHGKYNGIRNIVNMTRQGHYK